MLSSFGLGGGGGGGRGQTDDCRERIASPSTLTVRITFVLLMVVVVMLLVLRRGELLLLLLLLRLVYFPLAMASINTIIVATFPAHHAALLLFLPLLLLLILLVLLLKTVLKITWRLARTMPTFIVPMLQLLLLPMRQCAAAVGAALVFTLVSPIGPADLLRVETWSERREGNQGRIQREYFGDLPTIFESEVIEHARIKFLRQQRISCPRVGGARNGYYISWTALS
mmetsp:Transcript_3001/g.4582  ORF Transcript_3001/g.4582 Transcript_3001/m.4582 type:complete len:227 (-) Transcript_3001:371-1051(-)